MAKLPYGYQLDPNDVTKKTIIPSTQSNFFKAKPVMIPQTGVPDGYYRVSSGYMAVLPPNMKPKLSSIDADGVFRYLDGYINENEYYAQSFPIPNDPNINPDNPPTPMNHPPIGTYFNDKGGISVLPYGKIANTNPSGSKYGNTNGIGYSDNPDLILNSKGGETYNNVSYQSDNLDIQYHDTADNILKQNDIFTDASYGAITVRDRNGNLIVLPRQNLQGDITFLTPGSFKYQSNNYVPNYEDSVFLSRATYLHTYSNFYTSDKNKGFCEAYKDDQEKIEEICNELSPDTCASSSCCVLLGGAKCVSGKATGPNNRSHYGDVLLRNTDFYYYKGKCYGNCVE